MNNHAATETPQVAPAVGAQVERGVGRLRPKHGGLTPLQQRIVAALTVAPRQRIGYHDLALHLWPHETHPRAWRYSSNGGPHGWCMPLGTALRKLREAGIAHEWRPDGGPGRGTVVLLKTPNAKLTGGREAD